MQSFDQLGDEIQEQWKAAGFDPLRFAEVAVAALGRTPPAALLDWRQVAEAFLDEPRLPVQRPRRAGDPQVTVYTQSRFCIEVVFRVDGDAAIHGHAFRGAFHLLDGEALHCSYRFDAHPGSAGALLLGEAHLVQLERLARGATRPIDGAGLVHTLFHLDRPSATVVIRTLAQDAGPAHELLPPHLALGPLEDEALGRRLAVLALLRDCAAPDAVDRLASFVEQQDPEASVRALRAAWDYLVDEDRLEEVLNRARVQHGDLFDAVVASLEREHLILDLQARRHDVRDAELRFFVALLLTVPDRGLILRMVAEEVPGPPVITVLRWARALTTVGDDGAVDLLGIVVTPEDTPHAADLDEPLVETLHGHLRALVEQAPPEERLRRLMGRNPRLDREPATALLASWSPLETSLFKALF